MLISLIRDRNYPSKSENFAAFRDVGKVGNKLFVSFRKYGNLRLQDRSVNSDAIFEGFFLLFHRQSSAFGEFSARFGGAMFAIEFGSPWRLFGAF